MRKKIFGFISALMLLITVFALGATMAIAATALKITKQPASVVAAPSGSKAKVSITATGDSLKYTWYYKDKDDSKYIKDKKNTGKTYSAEMKKSINGRKVYCVVKDKSGKTVKSSVATLKMGKPAKITTEPSNVAVAKNKTAKVTVKASGDSLKYTWYFKNKGASKFTKDSKNTSKTYSVKMTSKINGRQVYCVVKDKHGSSVKTKTVTLYMGNAAKITKQPAAVYVAAKNATAKVSFTASGDSLKYTWYFKNKGASKFSKDTKVTGKTYSVKMSSKFDGRQVYCVVTDKYGTSVKSSVATLRMGNAAKITTQPSNVTVAKNATAKVTVKASGDSLKYTWYYKNKGASKFTKDSKNTSKTYSVKMTSTINGRQVYCVVKDKYGTSVKSSVVTLKMGNAAKITTQPSSVKVNCGSTAKVTVKASGDSLKYTWYYKNSGASKFTKDTKNTGASYSAKMDKSANGRQVYCVVKDKYGTSVQSKTVTLTASHVYDKGVVTKAATCAKDGVKTFTCKCSVTKTEAVAKLGHKMGGWTVMREATVTSTGYERSKCTRSGCTYYKDRNLEKLKAIYTITVNTGEGKPYYVGVAENGKYSLEAPVKVGYNFAGWKTSKGADFAASGVNKGNVTVEAQWTLDGTDTFAELKERTDALVEEIRITADITVNEPIFISHKTKLYSDGNYTIKRADNYAGDIFVVGRARDGKTALDHKRNAELELGNGKGVLTLDGNRDNVKVNVVGSMLFIADSSKVNMYDGVKIVNNIKLGNDRINPYIEMLGSSYYKKAGGAAIINLDSAFNMYGGEISNNIVATEYTEEINPETQAVTNQEYNGCGGAIFNCGDFNMYGGEISGNEALRGGAIYTHRILKLISGTVSDNFAHVYGGAISTSAASNADTYIGSAVEGNMMTFKNNRSLRAGGVFYSNTCSPILIEGNTEFINNRSESSGGAIYTAGPLLINDTLFDGNSCPGNGGAIYHHYSNPNYDRRFFEMNGCTLTNNSGSLGGAMIFSAADAVADTGMGTYATINDCTFSKNNASSNGGALYITRKGDVTIDRCIFTENSASGSAGAISMHSQSNVIITDTAIKDNTASAGGGINIASGTVATLKNIEFRNNSAKRTESGTNGNGGALYIYDSGVLNVENVDFYGNTAENHAGALYLGVTELKLDETCDFDGNSAGEHGGAIYMTYKTVKETNEKGEEVDVRYGAKLNATNVTFKNNSAKSGGAISARTATEVNLTNSVLTKNNAASEKAEEGGGAIFANNNTVNLSGTQLVGNSSAYYGGAITALSANVTIKDNSQISDNIGKTGAAVNFRGAGAYSLTDVSVAKNGNGNGSGIVYATGGSTLNLTRVTATGNNSYSGGVVYASGASTVVNISDSIFTENNAVASGGAVCFKDATVNVANCQLSKNTSKLGGAFYSEKGTLDVRNTTFTENTASQNGGAIDIVGTAAKISENTSFTNNSATEHGGAVYVNYIKKVAATETAPEVPAVYSDLVVDGGKFEANNAKAGGAVSIRTGSEATFNGTTFTNNTVTGYQLVDSGNKPGKSDGDGEGGGAIYVGFGTVNLNNVTATGNEAIASEYVNDKQVTKLYGFGGFINGYQAEINIVDGSISNSKAPSGGAINLVGSNNVLTIDGTAFNNNESTYVNTVDYDNTKGGGAINASKATITITEATFDGSKTNWYGGAAILSGSTVTIDKSTFTNSTGATGAALNIKSGSDVTITDTEIKTNNSTYNGVVYANSSTVTMNNVTATGNKAVNGGVLYVSGSSTAVEMNGSTFSDNTATSGGVAFTENATLKFNECTISGNKATGNGGVVFSKTGAAKIELNSCEVSGNSAKSGGVVYTEPGASVKTNSTVFTENKASSSGGAFYVKEATEFVVDASTFTKNYSKSNGGAIYVYRTPMTLKASAFTENSTDAHGGAINNIGAVITATGDNTFTSNTAKNHAGAIYVTYISAKEATETEPAVEAAVGVLNMTGGSFTGNSALGGGAFSVRTGCEATLTDTVLTGNTVEGYQLVDSGNKPGKNDGDGEGGGAIYVGFGKVTLNNVTATGNEAVATEYVNADQKTKLYSFGGVVDSYNADVFINGGTFSGNKAATGGVIFAKDSDVSVTGAQFNSNESTYVNSDYDSSCGGGAIAISGGTLTVDSSTFDGNKSDYYGGAVAALGTTVNVLNNSVFKNSTGKTGAAIYSSGSSKLTVDQSSFTKNTSGNNGVIYVSGTLNMSRVTATENNGIYGILNIGSGTASVSESTFSNNTVTKDGGAVFAKNCTLTLADNTFSENSANQGGAVYVYEAKEFTLDASSFTKNHSKANGGAIYVYRTPMTLKASSFTENSTDAHGGAINNIGSVITATGNNSFTENSAVNHGGAIYVTYISAKEATEKEPAVEAAVGVLNMTGGTFESNTAASGAAISARTGSEVKLTSTVFKNNFASSTEGNGGGGAIYSNDGTLTLSGVIADGNKTAYYGGVITTADMKNVTISGNSEFKNTSGKTGTVFNFRGTGTHNLTDVTVKDNGSGDGNGLIYITGTGSLNLTRVTVSGNNIYNGGAIYNSGSTVVNITDSTISGNTAVNGGGAIFYASSGAFTVSGSTVSGNTAKYGAAIYHNSTGAFSITNSTVSGNTATDGGAVYQNSTGTFTATGTTFSGNTAKHSGGAIYAKGAGAVTTENCIFEKNKATAEAENTNLISRGGGAIYVGSDGNVSVTGGSFSENSEAGTKDESKMTDAGGAILVDGGSLTVNGTAFTSNTANNGGAIGTSKAATTKMDIGGCTFTGNHSTQNGGGIYIQNGVKNDVDDIVITDCTFVKNVAEKASGASIYVRTNSSAKLVNISCSEGEWSYKGEIYATTGTRVTLEGSVTIKVKDSIVFANGGTAVIINYKTEDEKTTWESSISLLADKNGNKPTVTYNQI